MGANIFSGIWPDGSMQGRVDLVESDRPDVEIKLEGSYAGYSGQTTRGFLIVPINAVPDLIYALQCVQNANNPPLPDSKLLSPHFSRGQKGMWDAP